MAIMDEKSAFDVVQHTILLDMLLDRNIDPRLWLIVKDMYSVLTSRIKWAGGLSESYNICQGVRQGDILSTHLYKIFVEDLLLELEENSLGFQLGNIFIGTLTCADDVAFIENDKDNLQVMLNVIERYADQHHYQIHPTKTKIIEYTNTQTNNHKWYLNERELESPNDATYLGITRTVKNECGKNVEERIKTARCTSYSLMGSGMHGTNGIDPCTSYQIYTAYVLPRLLYGLELLPLKRKHVDQLEKFHRQSIRYMQSLPQRTSVSAVYLLIGALPVEAE